MGADATGIETVENAAAQAAVNDNYYNVSGQRVNESYHGIVLHNGKKYVK